MVHPIVSREPRANYLTNPNWLEHFQLGWPHAFEVAFWDFTQGSLNWLEILRYEFIPCRVVLEWRWFTANLVKSIWNFTTQVPYLQSYMRSLGFSCNSITIRFRRPGWSARSSWQYMLILEIWLRCITRGSIGWCSGASHHLTWWLCWKWSLGCHMPTDLRAYTK